jgi:hypothetical protein
VPDRRRTVLEHASRRALRHNPDGLTASVQMLDTYNTQTLVVQPNEWQTEAWAYYHSLGELNFAIGSWLSNAVSRCRLFAAQRIPGTDDPTPVLDGPIADIVSGLAGGLAGQTAMLKRMAVHMSIPGDSYLVTEDDPIYGNRTSKVYSNAEIRITSRKPLTYQVNTERSLWRSLAPEALVSRVWWPDEEFSWRATSPSEAALPIMREIDMYNRYIISVLLSRVASNGILLIPKEVTFPVKPQFKDTADPFMAEWIDIASRAIKNPGSAAAALPMPLTIPAQYIEMFKHLTFATEMGDKVLEDRALAIDRLAAALNMPPEAMKGMGDTNHWGAWQISEDAVKLHISPVVEVIVAGLTESFLRPMAAAADLPLQLPDGSEYIIWYDASALVQQPDRTDEAQALHDRAAISDMALRRDSGFEEADKPTTDQLKTQVLTKIAMGAGPDSLAALSVLIGDPSIALIPTRVTVTDPTTTPPDQLGDPNAPPETPPPGPAAPDKAPPQPPADTNPAPAGAPPARQ